MFNLHKHGNPPYSVAVVHGGPGAGGEMAPVAREIASTRGVLEPIQTAKTVDGQIRELQKVLEKWADLPVTLIGFSWGAWLGWLLAASFPASVRRLVLIGSGPFEEKYVAGILQTRFNRLDKEERAEARSLLRSLADKKTDTDQSALARVGALFSRADAFEPVAADPEDLNLRVEVYQGVWPEAAELRRTGKLLAMADQICCPVVAVHGDYDPHPATGVREPLSAALKDFRFVLLKNCGHRPWQERGAADTFFRILAEEIL